LRKTQEYGGVTVVAATVTYGEGVDVAPYDNGGEGTICAPDGYDPESAHIGMNLVGVELLKLGGDEVVGVPFVARYAGMVV
jgi:hypothetical protein